MFDWVKKTWAKIKERVTKRSSGIAEGVEGGVQSAANKVTQGLGEVSKKVEKAKGHAEERVSHLEARVQDTKERLNVAAEKFQNKKSLPNALDVAARAGDVFNASVGAGKARIAERATGLAKDRLDKGQKSVRDIADRLTRKSEERSTSSVAPSNAPTQLRGASKNKGQEM